LPFFPKNEVIYGIFKGKMGPAFIRGIPCITQASAQISKPWPMVGEILWAFLEPITPLKRGLEP